MSVVQSSITTYIISLKSVHGKHLLPYKNTETV